MKFRVLMFSVFVLASLLTACSTPELRNDQLLRDSSIVSDDPACAAPCWRGITPGETAWSDALTILEDDPTLENVTVTEDEASEALVAEFQQQGGASGCCQMYSQDGETVSVLFLRTAPAVTVGDLIEAKGEPTYVLGTPFADTQAVINLVYPEIQTVIYAFVEGEQGALSASSEIIGMLLTTTADMELLLLTSNLHTWEGYQTFNDYMGGDFEVTQAVTLTPVGTPAATDEAADEIATPTDGS